MKTHNTMLVLGTAALMSMAATAKANVIWRGDFETGGIGQWSSQEMVSSNRLTVVQDPVQEGKFALKATVHKGDDPINASGNRNELLYTGDLPKEADRWYRWSTLFPSDFKSADTWQLFTQWHHQSGGGSPPVEFFVRGETVYLRISGKDVWSTPLVRGQWHEFLFHVYWSTSASRGLVELTYDGVPAVKTNGATLYSGTGSAYLKQGLYRDEAVSWDQTIFHDGMTVGTTMEDVLPPPIAAPPPADTGAPDPAVDPGTGGDTSSAAVTPSGEGTVAVKAAGCAQVDASMLGLAAAGLAAMFKRRRR